MSNHTDQELLVDIRRRLTRVESRLCRVADHVGANVETPEKELSIYEETDTAISLDTPAMDVTLSEITRFLTKKGKKGKVAYVHFNNRVIARFEPIV
jgi:hypothetical protein